jgi:hypothetical protein
LLTPVTPDRFPDAAAGRQRGPLWCARMSPALGTLLGAFIGAAAVIFGGFLVESYRRHRDLQGIASALAGEVAGILHMTEKRDYPRYLERVLGQLDAGQNVPIPKLIGGSDNNYTVATMFPVMDRYLDKLGLLPGTLPERIVRFYQFVGGIRLDLDRLATNEFDAPGKASLIREDLDLWKETSRLGEQLVRELRDVAATTFLGATT